MRSTEPGNRADPAYRAANAARVLGVLITLIAALILIASLFTLTRMGPIEAALMLGIVLLIYCSPGIALLVLSGAVKRRSKGPTIAVLVIACVIAAILWLGVVAQAVLLISSGQLAPALLLPGGFMLIVATIATLLAVYCIQSLRFPDPIDPKRGFEPILPEAVPGVPDDSYRG